MSCKRDNIFWGARNDEGRSPDGQLFEMTERVVKEPLDLPIYTDICRQ